MFRDRLMGGRTIVGTIGDDFFYFFFNLRQQWPRLRRVVRKLIGEHLGNDHVTVGVDRKMQLAPRPARLRAMFCYQPLACSEDFQTCTVNQHMQRSLWGRR